MQELVLPLPKLRSISTLSGPQWRGEEKATLARLARLCYVSKRVCAIAQPVLFHYYASFYPPLSQETAVFQRAWNTCNTLHIPQATSHCYSNHNPDDEVDNNLPAFLRTIIHLPDLAACIKVLQLRKSDSIASGDPSQFVLLNEAGRALRIERLPGLLAAWEKDLRHPDIKLVGKRRARRQLYNFIEQLTILLTPRAEILTQESRFPSYYRFLDDSLRACQVSVPFNDYGTDFHLYKSEASLYTTPKLDNPLSLECRNNEFRSDEGIATRNIWRVAFSNLRKLVFDGQRVSDLKVVVSCCPNLEDIGYHMHESPESIECVLAIAPARAKIKRLCLEHSPNCYLENRDDICPSDFEVYLYGDPCAAIQTTLQEFMQLEDLVISQSLLYCPDSNPRTVDTCRLVNLLPPSIHSVQFTYVYKGMQEDLMNLARQTPTSFTKLETIMICLARLSLKERVSEIKELAAVEFAFAEIGVQVLWGKDKYLTSRPNWDIYYGQ